MQKALKKQKNKARPNPFQGATDVYLTKNKIAVERGFSEKKKRGNINGIKTKYYARNSGNMRLLKVAQGDKIRRGRNGTKFETI